MSTEVSGDLPESRDVTRRPRKVFVPFLVFACAVLSVEVVLLVLKNRELEARVIHLVEENQAPTIEVGDVIEPFTLLSESGEKILLEFDEGQPKSLLLVFTQGCGACDKMLPIWGDAIPVEASPGLRVLAISLDEPEASSPDLFPFPVHTPAGLDAGFVQEITRIPATILLDEYGVVEKVWSGLLSPDDTTGLRKTVASLVQVP